MPAPKPRDFRSKPANPNDLRALEPDEDRGAVIDRITAEAMTERLNVERLVPLTNAEAAALLTLSHAALQAGIVTDAGAKPWVESARLKLARVIASV